MATKRGESVIKSRIELVGLREGDPAPDLAVRLTDSGGRVIATVAVGKDGAFQVPGATLDKAARVLIGPAEADLSNRAAFRSYDPEHFRSAVEAGIAISKTRWSKWLQWTRCVGGRVGTASLAAAGRSVVARLASWRAAPRRVTETAKLSASTSIVTAGEPSASRMRSSSSPRT